MKLSFVIPAYNEQDYLGECIESIKREAASSSYPIEIIVVNNASTDKTAEVARSYSDVQVVDEPLKGLEERRVYGLFWRSYCKHRRRLETFSGMVKESDGCIFERPRSCRAKRAFYSLRSRFTSAKALGVVLVFFGFY